MSQPIPHAVSCPKCGKPIEFTLWRSIDTTEEDATDNIISGKLFRLVCPACGGSTVADYPMLVNDTASGMIIWYLSPDEEEAAKQVIESGKYEHRIRLVDSQTSLREKTALFSELLDDRLIELMKLITLERMDTAGKTVGDMWYVCRNGKRRFELTLDGKIACYDLDMAVYETLRMLVGDYLLKEGDTTRVNLKWAEDFLTRTGASLLDDGELDFPGSNPGAEPEQ